MRARRNGKVSPASAVVMGICVVVTLLIRFCGLNEYDAAILLGAYYKPFIMAGEWWRLLSSGFVHVSFLHLLVNLLSLMNLGPYMEKRLGAPGYLAVLLGSIIGGSLFTYVSAGNVLMAGLSGGLYGLMAGYSYILFQSNAWRNQAVRQAMLRVYIVNILISLMPGISMTAHFGGFITGLVLTGLLDSKEYRKHFALAGLAFFLAIGYFCTRPQIIKKDERYIGTDINVLKRERDLGLRSHAYAMAEKLDRVYGSDGAIFSKIKEEK